MLYRFYFEEVVSGRRGNLISELNDLTVIEKQRNLTNTELGKLIAMHLEDLEEFVANARRTGHVGLVQFRGQ